MVSLVERSYGSAFKLALSAVNPLKKIIVKTECKVHKFINNQAVEILKGDDRSVEYKFFNKHIVDLNLGVVWADQDFKSRNHFYSPETKRGMYGSSNAMKECMAYYSAALTCWNKEDIKNALFYLGAACHISQDVTIPQHVNVNLLKNHRKYEQWVIMMHEREANFSCWDNGIYLSSIKDFIEENARTAIKVYHRSKNIVNLEERFYNITDTIFCQAQRATAGILSMFYQDVCGMDKKKNKECIVE